MDSQYVNGVPFPEKVREKKSKLGIPSITYYSIQKIVFPLAEGHKITY